MKPKISGKELSNILLKIGFVKLRQTGSHMFLERQGIRTTIPIHNNKDIGDGLLNKILKDVKLTKNDLRKLR